MRIDSVLRSIEGALRVMAESFQHPARGWTRFARFIPPGSIFYYVGVRISPAWIKQSAMQSNQVLKIG